MKKHYKAKDKKFKNFFILGIQTAEFPNEISLIKINSKSHKVECTYTHKFLSRDSVENLGKATSFLCRKIGIQTNQINLVAVCIGPGSYTGTRGGVAFAKGLCQFSGIPLVGMTIFEVLGSCITDKGCNVAFLIDAKNDRAFYVFKKANCGNFDIGTKEIKVTAVDRILNEVKVKTIFVGSGALIYRRKITDLLKDKAQFLTEKLYKPLSKRIAWVGYMKYQKKKSMFSKSYLLNLRPAYILAPRITYPKSL